MNAIRGWNLPAGVAACFTTRVGGVSTGAAASLNLASHVGDDAAAVRENRRRLHEQLQLAHEPVWLRQVHGTRIVHLTEYRADTVADGAITACGGLVCAVMVADCVPILMCDRDGTEVAAVHAGWRGLVAGILPRAVHAFAAPAERLTAWLGPAISARRYAVGPDLMARFCCHPAFSASDFPCIDGHTGFDLRAFAARELGRLGLSEVAIDDTCVYDDSERYFSHRRDHLGGRMAALIWRR